MSMSSGSEDKVTEEDAIKETANGERYTMLEINKSGRPNDELPR